MGRKSTIHRLDPKVKAAIDAALKDGRLTLDEILDQVRAAFGAELAPARSTLGRYKQNFDVLARQLRETREVADIWAQKFGSAPDSDVGKVVLEMLRTLSYRVGADLMESGDVDAKSVAQLGKAMQYVEDAGRIGLAREKELRKAVAEAAADKVAELEKGAKKSGLDAKTLKRVREEIYGLAA